MKPAKKKIKKLSKKIKPSGNIFMIHDTRGDIRTLAALVNEVTDKINEIVEVLNKEDLNEH